MKLEDVFTLIGNLCTIAKPLVPGVGGQIFEFAGLAAKAGAGWAKAGDDPVVAITRHLDLDKLEVEREAHWAVELEKRRAGTAAPDTIKDPPGSDPYEGG